MRTFYTLLLIPIFCLAQGNPAMTEANIDDVWSQFGLTGNGVIFANIERGIDYTHPAYINDDGTTRIAYLFDMIDPTGANDPNNPYGVGTIHTEADINASLMSGGTPLSTDRFGHGTACTGITAGNGRGTAGLEFKGAAPEATIIAVKLIHDAFPPFGSEPGQSGFFDASYIPIALEFVKDKVAELGLPSVTLMNFGSIGGATDGTSLISRAMDDFIADGHILVCGVGDDGGGDNHAAGTVSQGGTQEITINKTSSNGFNLRFDLWYSEDDRFNVTVEVPGGTQYGPYSAPASAGAVGDVFPGPFNFYHRGANVEFSQATSNRRELLIDFFSVPGTYKVILNGASITDTGNFNASLNPSTYSNTNAFTSHIVSGHSINDYTSAFDVITPGDYVVDNTWTDINGIPRSRTGEGNPGELWAGSSSGPTYDGRQGIDFVTPGEVIFSPYSPNTYYANFDFNLVQGGNGLYGIQTAVSAAAPLACGIIALMLELDPTLTNQEVKNILTQTSREDSFTGTTPNNDWGYGKADALAAVQMVSNQLSIQESTDQSIKIYPNPAKDYLIIKSNTPIGNISIYSIDGRDIGTLHLKNGKADISFLSAGLYLLNYDIQGNRQTFKLIIK